MRHYQYLRLGAGAHIIPGGRWATTNNNEPEASSAIEADEPPDFQGEVSVLGHGRSFEKMDLSPSGLGYDIFAIVIFFGDRLGKRA